MGKTLAASHGVRSDAICALQVQTQLMSELICRETFQAVYYFLLFLASLFSSSQCWQVCCGLAGWCNGRL